MEKASYSLSPFLTGDRRICWRYMRCRRVQKQNFILWTPASHPTLWVVTLLGDGEKNVREPEKNGKWSHSRALVSSWPFCQLCCSFVHRQLFSLRGLECYIWLIFLLVANSPSEGSSFFALMAFHILGWGGSFLLKERALFFPLVVRFCCFNTKTAVPSRVDRKWLVPSTSEGKYKEEGALIWFWSLSASLTAAGS